MDSNFMLQDILGSALAFVLFSIIFIFPGYATGWTFNLFEFRTRTTVAQLVMGIFISASIIPSTLFLFHKFGSSRAAIGLLFLLTVYSLFIYFTQKQNSQTSAQSVEYQRPTLALAALWVIFSIFILIDLQIGNRLYFSNNAYDLLTRVSVVDAMTRTGVPPVNPSYYPGHEVRLNFLYYYWYILASIVDQIGGALVSAQHAMIASISWCGIILFATVASYLRVRSPNENAWKRGFIAIQLFAISGVDCVLIILAILKEGFLPNNGQIEGWNMPIMSWLNAFTWVPHHVTAAVACIFAMLVLAQWRREKFLHKVISAVLIGLAFASAFGLSVWVMFVFGIFWAVWAIQIIFQEKDYGKFWVMAAGGLLGIAFVFPFLIGLLGGSGSSSAAKSVSPVALYIRPFAASTIFFSDMPPLILNISSLLFLPVNYLFELGFFFLVAMLWIQDFYKSHKNENPIYKAELTLVIITTITLSFLYSTLIAINDLGIRGWIPMQIILIVWSVDLIGQFIRENRWVTPKIFRAITEPKRLGTVFGVTLILGLLTSGLEVVSLRMWSVFIDMNLIPLPNQISMDDHLGERTYYARLAYEYLNENTPATSIVQNNPLDIFDRPSGLYSSRQMVISDRTMYGVSLETYKELSSDIGKIFKQKTNDWNDIDKKCGQYAINVLIIKDTDPLWVSLPTLKLIRPPLYENAYYALYSCGK